MWKRASSLLLAAIIFLSLCGCNTRTPPRKARNKVTKHTVHYSVEEVDKQFTSISECKIEHQ